MAFGRLGSLGGGFGRLGVAGAGVIPPGAALLITDEADALAVDFTHANDARRVAVKTAGVVTDYGLDSFFTNAATGPKQVYDVSGNLVWAPHNFYLQSATPATRTVTTVTGATYTVTVTGTGTLTGSSGAAGVASAGSPLTYTATGTSSIFTLAGSLTQVQMNRGTVATAYLATTAAARMGLAVDYDPATHASRGLLVELAAINLLLNNEALSTQSVTVSAIAYTLSFLGTGTITLSGVSTAGPLVGTGAGNRVSLTFTPTAGSLTLTVTGTVSKAQLEAGIIASSFVPSFGAAVTRAGDGGIVTALLSAIPSYSATAGTIYVDWEPILPTTVFQAAPAELDDGTLNERILLWQASTSATQVLVVDGGVSQATIAGVMVNSARTQISAAWQVNDFAASVNGAAVVTDVAGTLPTLTTLRFGGAPPTSAVGNNRIRRLVYVPRRVSNASLPTWKYTP